MAIDEISFAPPDDLTFQSLILRATRDQVPAFGAVIRTEDVRLTRAFESHRPENMRGGAEVVRKMFSDWQAGKPTQPWLYAKGDEYIVADDYFWLALVEKGRPPTFSAQILGEPLSAGLIQKVGPLGPDFVKRSFGFA